ncbi:MAG: hypothetical protein NZ553_11260 [Caldilinea sp.]|nr:hypothetical protein [Caldilinea sp.]MDW8441043.1 hypothetical protein [Caldilineaceae bacterium]
MGPIEILFCTVVVIFAFIGSVRGAHRELGNSIILMYVVAILRFADERGWIERSVQVIRIVDVETERINDVAFLLVVIVFTAVVIVSYQGLTFDFSTKALVGVSGFLAGLGVGALNGYLIAGTYWYYADRYGYPFNLLTGPLTPVGQILLGYLPQTIFPNSMYWAIPATILMILRILR